MNRRKSTFIIVSLIVLLGGSFGLSKLFISMKPDSPKRPAIDMKRFVQAETVQYGKVISPLEAKGRVISSSEVALVAEASGKVQQGSVALKKGTSFKKGQLLAVIYKDEVELALKASKSKFLNTITTLLPDLKVDYPGSFDAFMKFFNDIDINKEMPDLPDYSNEKLKVFLASRSLLSDYYGILQDEKKLGRHYLYAPFNGAFTQVSFEVGAYVNIGGQVARMIRTDELEVEVPVKNIQSKWIEKGDKVKIYSGNGNKYVMGNVVRKSNFIDEDTQSRSIFVKLPDVSSQELLAGDYKKVEFPGQEIENAMQLPRNAVFNSNEVFVVIEGMLKKKEINVLKWNENTLVFDGLQEGSKVVTQPLINARENSPVGILGEESSGSVSATQSNQNKEQKQSKSK
ncbi:efflux RND transporter periplasmic adaptor subunit [Plebeiibacterium marinum]|uniref:Efflux RND transporter periplasmic adaptor subunit n=1 Tax=Plebeiibacterium marinum TaxID=2992111 RepID=A0AAE3MGA0_9BACT|nr:efflux RND transporter periplasmic adaptor subunit [Plebeiobacterium marinum]MCW3807102.1 efflux RND transporter periplasmic adaptor subunit [Plebeiobacterium marinum]